jgi:signal peptidase
MAINKLGVVVRRLMVLYIGVLLIGLAAAVGVMKAEQVRLLSVQTGSMAPTFRPGDAVLVKPAAAGTLRSGQVISYISPISGQTISHRVVAVDRARNQLTTRGDVLSEPDTPITQLAIVGRVVVVLPRAGMILGFVKRPLGLVLFVYLPAIAIVAGEMRGLACHYGRRYYRLAASR